MKYRQIGPFRTSAIAYGSMPLSIEGRPDRETAINILHDVLDAGCTHIDTAWAYYESGGVEQYGERLVADAWRHGMVTIRQSRWPLKSGTFAVSTTRGNPFGMLTGHRNDCVATRSSRLRHCVPTRSIYCICIAPTPRSNTKHGADSGRNPRRRFGAYRRHL
ncbi:possible oxidoreductase of the aldo/keto reductase family [Cutibacterium acnes JCM 18909]|nr:possible oxidoreductase of the aldo/keto reductase family [Cutibacterium acnes JCM 18909]